MTNQTVEQASTPWPRSAQTGYTQVGGWSSTGPGGTLNRTELTIVDNANVRCTVTNRFGTGSLQVAKVVEGPDGGFPDTSYAFSGRYDCGTGYSGEFTTLTTTTPVTIANLPAGRSCTVTETAPTGSDGLANTSYTWTGTSYDPAQSVTIVQQGTATVTITNTYVQNTGSLILGKQVQARDGTDETGYTGGADRPFPMHYECTIGQTTVASGDRDVTPGATVAVDGIPATSSCAVTETLHATADGDFADSSYAWDGSTNDGPGSIPVDGSVTVTTTNYFAKLIGQLTLSKVVEGEGYTGGTGEHFTVDWDCGAVAGSVTLADGGSETVAVPANLSCTVAEETPSGNLAPGWEWGPPTYDGLTNGSVTVAPGASATVTVTNHTSPVYGTLTVTKEITGETSGVIAGTRFPVQVACDAPAQGETTDYTEVFNLLPDSPMGTPDLQVGTSCTVTEESQPELVDASYAWDPIPDPQTVTIDEAGQAVEVTVTNNVRRVYGSLSISKIVEPLDGLDGAGVAFSGSWSCRYGSRPTRARGRGPVPAPATLSGDDETQIPLTSQCTVRENSPDDPPSAEDESYAWGGVTITGPVTLTADEPEGHVDVTNSIVRADGGFIVAKTVIGGEAGVAYENDDFTFTYTCQPETGDPLTGTLTALSGRTATLPNGAVVPLGSECVVTETGLADPIDPYRWADTTYQVDGGDLTADPAVFTVTSSTVPVRVTVRNTLEEVTVPLTVTKRVTGETAGYTGTTFPVAVLCTSPNGFPRIYRPGQARGRRVDDVRRAPRLDRLLRGRGTADSGGEAGRPGRTPGAP